MEYIKANIDSETNITNNKVKVTSVEYIYYDYIDIIPGDPISAITLTNKFVIIGTMTGMIKLYHFNEKRIYIISKNDIEYISGLSYSEKDNVLYASIGCDHYIKFEMKEPFVDEALPYSIINLSLNGLFNNTYCDNYILMSSNNILRLKIFIPEFEEKINDDSDINYDITFLKNNSNSESSPKIGMFKSTNYYVPLDYDGKNLCYIEYMNDRQDRNICVQNILSEGTPGSLDNYLSIDAKYGHVSHAKLLRGNKVLIVHNFNECQIYKVNQHFDKVENFTHLGDEVYSVDVIYGFNAINKSYNRNNFLKGNNYSLGDDYGTTIKVKESENQKLKVKEKRLKNCNSENKLDTINCIKLNLKNNRREENKLNYAIITLDIDGDVNKYENKREEKLFNLYEINGINQDFKDKKFFDMGYMYFIKANLNFFCITTDHGCFIIKKNKT